MLSVNECREYLGESNLSNEQIKQLRDTLYVLAENLIDDYINNSVKIETTCKKV